MFVNRPRFSLLHVTEIQKFPLRETFHERRKRSSAVGVRCFTRNIHDSPEVPNGFAV